MENKCSNGLGRTMELVTIEKKLQTCWREGLSPLLALLIKKNICRKP